MAFDRVDLVLEAAPILAVHGYCPTHILVLAQIARRENQKMRKAFEEQRKEIPLKAWCYAAVSTIAREAITTPSYVRRVLRQARLDGLVEIRQMGLRRSSCRRINAEAFKALVQMSKKYKEEFADGNKDRKRVLIFPPVYENMSARQPEADGICRKATEAGRLTVKNIANVFERDLLRHLIEDHISANSLDLLVTPNSGSMVAGHLELELIAKKAGLENAA